MKHVTHGNFAARPATTGTRRRAFTLVELLVVMSITALVLGSTSVILRQVSAARQRVDEQAGHQLEAAAALRTITTALRNIYRLENDEPIVFEGLDEQLGSAPADRLRFFTVSRRTIRPNQPESDVREVEFFLSPSNDSPFLSLLRRTDPTRNLLPDGGGVIERVADNIVALNFLYHDGQQWLDEWPARIGRPPQIVRVEITVVTDPQRQRTATFRRLVNFPYRQSGQQSESSTLTNEPS